MAGWRAGTFSWILETPSTLKTVCLRRRELAMEWGANIRQDEEVGGKRWRAEWRRGAECVNPWATETGLLAVITGHWAGRLSAVTSWVSLPHPCFLARLSFGGMLKKTLI
jgi:hypothetical protein